MNVKKIALIGVIVLVVIGFVVAAGCTANVSSNSVDTKTTTSATGEVTTTTNNNGKITTTTGNINDIVGTWKLPITAELVKKLQGKSLDKLLKEKGTNLDDGLTFVVIIGDDKNLVFQIVKDADGSVVFTNKYSVEMPVANKFKASNENGNTFEFDYDTAKKVLNIPLEKGTDYVDTIFTKVEK